MKQSIFAFLLACYAPIIYAQDTAKQIKPALAPALVPALPDAPFIPTETTISGAIAGILQNHELVTTIFSLVFTYALIATVLLAKPMLRLKQEYYYKLVIISILIGVTLTLISASYSERVLSPAFGLIGTIAGFMLSSKGSDTPPSPPT